MEKKPTFFTKIFNKENGKLGRKEGVTLTKNVSYIEPCKISDKTVDPKDREQIECTKVFHGESFIILEITILDFIKECSPKIEFI